MFPALAETDLQRLGLRNGTIDPSPGFIMKPVTKQARKLRPYRHKALPKEKNPAYAAIRSFFAATDDNQLTGTVADLQKKLARHSIIALPAARHIFMRRVNAAMLDLKKEGYALKSKLARVSGKPVRQYTISSPKSQPNRYLPKTAMTGMAIIKGSPLLSIDPLVLRLAAEEKTLKTKKEQIAALQKDAAQTQQLVEALRTVIRFTAK